MTNKNKNKNVKLGDYGVYKECTLQCMTAKRGAEDPAPDVQKLKDKFQFCYNINIFYSHFAFVVLVFVFCVISSYKHKCLHAVFFGPAKTAFNNEQKTKRNKIKYK